MGAEDSPDAGSSELVSSKVEDSPRIPYRDSEYYFEDGSITFRVENTLFKVHTSLLKLGPSNFEGGFDASSERVDTTRGTRDEIPIVIPNIKPSQFRNLMKVIYCPPSNKFFFSLPVITSAEIEGRDAWRKFIFYLDVASLAHEFGMHDIEKWAKPRLQSLVHTAARKISDGLDSTSSDDDLGFGGVPSTEGGDNDSIRSDPEDITYEEDSEDAGESAEDVDGEGAEGGGGTKAENGENDGDDEDDYDSDEDEDYSDREHDSSTDDVTDNENDEQDDSDQLIAAEDSPIFRFIDGIWYAREISDVPLLHDIRNILQWHCGSLPVDLLLSFFRVPNLPEKDSSTFGFLFLLLLGYGHEAWNRKMFTQMDRMAFFSAQCYLTPLPDSLKVASATPLFKKPESAKKFARRFSSNSTRASCIQNCYQSTFPFWQEEFDDAYYDSVTSNEPLIAIVELITIPSRRLRFSEKLRGITCEHRCYLRMLGRVDRDIQGLYTRLAEYYKPID